MATLRVEILRNVHLTSRVVHCHYASSIFLLLDLLLNEDMLLIMALPCMIRCAYLLCIICRGVRLVVKRHGLFLRYICCVGCCYQVDGRLILEST